MIKKFLGPTKFKGAAPGRLRACICWETHLSSWSCFWRRDKHDRDVCFRPFRRRNRKERTAHQRLCSLRRNLACTMKIRTVFLICSTR